MFLRNCLLSPKLYNVRSHSIDAILRFIKPGEEKILVKGWVRSVRRHKEIMFLSINDGSCQDNLQVILPADFLPQHLAATYGSSVEVTGQLTTSGGSQQAFDLNATDIRVLGECNNKEYPFKTNKHHPPDYLRRFLHLRPRTNYFSSLLRVRNSLTQALHRVLQEDGYIQVHTPILTSNDSEGAGEVFQVQPANDKILREVKEAQDPEDVAGNKHFFNVPTFLTVSGQLHLEAIAGGFCKVYTFGPTFRAESSRGRHHLAEFYMLEVELSFTEDLEDLMKAMERLIQKSTSYILDQNADDVNKLWKSQPSPDHRELVDNLITKEYIRMTHKEAVAILEKHNKQFTFKVQAGSINLQKEHERFLVKHCGNIPVFVTDFPANSKPFYMKINEDNETVAAVDLLLPAVGEGCGGSLRESRLDVLEDKLKTLGLEEDLSWYLDLRRYGSCPHGGFGLGFERLLQAVLGMDNIRDTIPFPRSVHSCKL